MVEYGDVSSYEAVRDPSSAVEEFEDGVLCLDFSDGGGVSCVSAYGLFFARAQRVV